MMIQMAIGTMEVLQYYISNYESNSFGFSSSELSYPYSNTTI